MRDILFRGKRKDSEKWIKGDLINNVETILIRERKKDTNGVNRAYIVDPETVGQYTGKRDLYNKQIFEGDILMFGMNPKDIYIVQYYIFFCTFLPFGVDPFDKLLDGYVVIGNIYDNPEFLSGGLK